ncbi:hypothetical protein Tsubulata_020861 [Turnera subulata]|uniref:MADS-box domain-containing protein n=1 Tax=Turnera subulata TaxID=218843 RepID=A0A9Q0J333_9ROSI|nr:hypothetical protein Tsubulata_020861 [Turnera subulata]
MGRSKMSMELITNERSRLVTYHKRTKGLFKKMEEFHILCDVDACAIVIGPTSSRNDPRIMTWPASSDEVKRIISRYRKDLSSDPARVKKTQNLSDYFATRKSKIEREIAVTRKAKMEAKFPRWSDQFDLLDVQQLKMLECVVESKLEEATRRLLELKGKQFLMDGSMSGTRVGPNLPCLSLTPSNHTSQFYDQKSMDFKSFDKQPKSHFYQKNMDFKTFDMELKDFDKQPTNHFNQKNMDFNLLDKQPTYSYYRQMAPFNLNHLSPTSNIPVPIVKMNVADQTQFGGMSTSSDSIPYSTVRDSSCYYTMAPMAADNEVFNFPGAYTGPSSQPLLPYMQAPSLGFNVSPQKGINQFSDSCDFKGSSQALLPNMQAPSLGFNGSPQKGITQFSNSCDFKGSSQPFLPNMQAPSLSFNASTQKCITQFSHMQEQAPSLSFNVSPKKSITDQYADFSNFKGFGEDKSNYGRF